MVLPMVYSIYDVLTFLLFIKCPSAMTLPRTQTRTINQPNQQEHYSIFKQNAKYNPTHNIVVVTCGPIGNWPWLCCGSPRNVTMLDAKDSTINTAAVENSAPSNTSYILLICVQLVSQALHVVNFRNRLFFPNKQLTWKVVRRMIFALIRWLGT